MQTLTKRSFFSTFSTYIKLTKPGILLGNLITTAGGFALGTRGVLNTPLFIQTLLGICCVMASGCVCNNYIDKDHDSKMHRTKNRALAKGTISPKSALIFATALGLAGGLILTLYTPVITTLFAAIGFLIYVVWYSFLKHKSAHATLIGALAGAVPPAVGYTAATGGMDLGGWLIFTLIVFWQMPHFYAIAIYRIKEYAKASIPVLPIVKGIAYTKIPMLLYILAFMTTGSLLYVFHYAGPLFLAAVNLLGTLWLITALQGFKTKNDTIWAKKMFKVSLWVIMGLSTALFLRICAAPQKLDTGIRNILPAKIIVATQALIFNN